MNNKSRIIIITGEIRQGKTTFVLNLAELLRLENRKVAGIVAIGRDADGNREGFDLLNISTGETTFLCSNTFQENCKQIGRYYFDPSGFSTGIEWLQSSLQTHPEMIIIDEIGPLELQDKGWTQAISILLNESKTLQIWVIRKGLVNTILSKWKIKDALVIDIANETIDTVMQVVNEKLNFLKQQ